MDKLYALAEKLDIEIINDKIPVKKVKGLCVGNMIILDESIKSKAEENCILAEELGHQITSFGQIINQNDVVNIKQEIRARRWAHDKMLQVEDILKAYKEGCRSLFEIAEYLGVTEEFLLEASETFSRRYGICKLVDNFIIYFDPLGIMEIF